MLNIHQWDLLYFFKKYQGQAVSVDQVGSCFFGLFDR